MPHFLLLLVAFQPAAGVDEKQLALLRTFRAEFIAISPGEGPFPESFRMGRAGAGGNAAERPDHEVVFDYSFKIAKYEVPQNLWKSVMGSNPSRWKGPRNSVELVSFIESQQFCARVTELLREAELIGPRQRVRLPSEAEWEYAARAGTTTVYSFGDDAARLGDFAWSTENAAGNDPAVGEKRPNPWGLYDIHGYLWEWCSDVWHEDYHGAPTNGSRWASGGDASRRVVRGGSWKDRAARLTSSSRRGLPVNHRDDACGLRCVLASD